VNGDGKREILVARADPIADEHPCPCEANWRLDTYMSAPRPEPVGAPSAVKRPDGRLEATATFRVGGEGMRTLAGRARLIVFDICSGAAESETWGDVVQANAETVTVKVASQNPIPGGNDLLVYRVLLENNRGLIGATLPRLVIGNGPLPTCTPPIVGSGLPPVVIPSLPSLQQRIAAAVRRCRTRLSGKAERRCVRRARSRLTRSGR
jgi:hypothetical protein